MTAAGTTLVIGAGGLEQLAIQHLRLLSATTVVVLDPSEPKQRARAVVRRLHSARAVPGAHHAAAPGDDLPAAEAVFDLVGSDATLRQAAEHVRPAGMVMIVGETGGRTPFGFSLVPCEADLTSSMEGSYQDRQAVLGISRRGDLIWDVAPVPLPR